VSTEIVLSLDHPAGLHLRPAALFVRTANRFTSQIRVQNLSRQGGPEVDAKSMLGLMQAAVSQGHQVRVRADGPDAAEALETLRVLVNSNFADPQPTS
jgi:phosphotransferase system HPr (HPr) family protein